MNALQLLEVLRDARELGDKAFEESVLEQLGLDAAYVELATKASAAAYRPRFDDDNDLLDYGDEPETEEERRARVGLTARNIERRDWLAWSKSGAWWRRHPQEVGGAASSLTSLAFIYKQVYSDSTIADIAMPPSPFFAMLKKEHRLALIDGEHLMAYSHNDDGVLWRPFFAMLKKETDHAIDSLRYNLEQTLYGKPDGDS